MTFVLALSFGSNVAFLALDTAPSIRNFLNQKILDNNPLPVDEAKLEAEVLAASLKMAESQTVSMPMKENNGVVRTLVDEIVRHRDSQSDLYFYPKAYLFAGVSDWDINKHRLDVMDKLKGTFDKFVRSDGRPSFPLDKVDQVPFGIAAINFYKTYGDRRYKIMAEAIFQKIKSWAADDDVIPYRFGKTSPFLVDTLGMLCPFLARYGKAFHDSDAMRIAKIQIQHYIQYGIDKDSFLPFHGIHRSGNLRLGPTNWGRGIGWYLLALAEYHANSGTEFDTELYGLLKTLELLSLDDSTWSQFPGSSERFDSSTTTMFLYGGAISQFKSFPAEKIYAGLKKSIYRGIVKSSSGDTLWINQYSKNFGDSELSQGMLMMFLGLSVEPGASVTRQ